MEKELIYSKIIEVMGKLNAISKDRNTNGNGIHFKYRGIDDVMNELHTKLAEAGVFIVPTVLHEERDERISKKRDQYGNEKESVLFYTRLTIKFTFYAEDGSHIESVVIGEAMSPDDKASNKALSIAFKYACLQVFCIPTEDDKDPDAECHEVAPKTTYKPQPAMYSKPAAPAPKQAPAAPAPKQAKTSATLAGGASTPEQQKEITMLLDQMHGDNTPMFTKEEKRDWLKKRTTMTADELIKTLQEITGFNKNLDSEGLI